MEKTQVDIKEKVGVTAGVVWQALSEKGPHTAAQLKKLNNGTDLVSFALGWLAREDKIEITSEKKSYRVRLK
jgi:hypothetical protein